MRSNSRRLALAGLLVILAVGLAACYPGGPEDLGEIGLVLTWDNPESDYSGLQTYAMPDTVLPLSNPEDDSSEPLDRRYDRLILDTIAAEMDSRGFVRELDPENNTPDVVVQVGASQNDAYLLFTYWGYPGYGWPGYGWGYPSTGAYQFKQGSIFWNMTDYRNVDPSDPGDNEETVPVMWISGLNGALTGTGTNPTAGIPNGIRQAFTQSPYIKATTTKATVGSQEVGR